MRRTVHPLGAVAAVCLLVLSLLTACGDNTPTSAATAATTTSAAATVATTTSAGTTTSAATTTSGAAASSGKRYQITLVVGQTVDNFYTSMQCGAQQEAKKLGDVDLSVQGPTTWDTQQIPIINALTAKKVDAIAVVVNDGKALYAPLKAANDAGIKILGVDTMLDDTSFEVTNISSDNKTLGKQAAQAMAKLIGDKGTVLMNVPTPGTSTVYDRLESFKEEMTANHPNIQLVYIGSTGTGSGSDQTVAAINAAFTAHPDINGIFAESNKVSEAATTVIQGLPPENKKSVNVVGFDASPTAVQAMQEGKVQALIAQKPAQMGAMAVDLARASLQGQTVPKINGVDGVSLTKDNISDPNYSQYIYKSTC